jgi:transaldolase
MTSQLDQLKSMTVIVADTGDIDAVKKYQPQDATTNPSLILAAAQKPEYRYLIDKALSDLRHVTFSSEEAQKEHLLDLIFVNFGLEILKHIPGRVSTEVDAHLAFDTEKSVQRARSLVSCYEAAGVPRERILIKLATTWEGIRAAEVLEMEDIHCNMTLIFSLVQAAAAANVKATLVSPFVGRILDWHKKNKNFASQNPAEDPGVKSASAIYNYLKKFDLKTSVMGASFRSKAEILELAGCDLLTIAPKFLDELQTSFDKVERKLSQDTAKNMPLEPLDLSEGRFRFLINDDEMCADKLADGIRVFAKDLVGLKEFVEKLS